mmetsp:Transcript_10631/g.18239  ORF Transcript_10631/g.18239 Transcript_10631/m.18239 type:complete len:215 (-) Transcript_10631:310-954(-)
MNSGSYGGGPNAHMRYNVGKLPENVKVQNLPGRAATPMPTSQAAKNQERQAQMQIWNEAAAQMHSEKIDANAGLAERKTDNFGGDKAEAAFLQPVQVPVIEPEKSIFADYESSDEEDNNHAQQQQQSPQMPPAPVQEQVPVSPVSPPMPPAPAVKSPPPEPQQQTAPPPAPKVETGPPPAPAPTSAPPKAAANPATTAPPAPAAPEKSGCCLIQ